jgi:aminoglycoside phosphotransferase (APT) family kinase protein
MSQSEERSDRKTIYSSDEVPVLKNYWERVRIHFDLDEKLAAVLLTPAFPYPIAELRLLSEGCANSNFKIIFLSGHDPVVLRIYVRDHSALKRELHLHELLNGQVPLADILHHDDSLAQIPHPFAVMKWVDGVLMRDIILSGNEQAIRECSREAGKYLAVLRSIRFTQGGFFQPDGSVSPFKDEEDYLPYVHFLLNEAGVKASLGTDLIAEVSKLIDENVRCIPDKDDANLTHADYDPANILVRQDQGAWKISAILDWEFSLASTYLLDVGLFLRYSHRLPSCYTSAFIGSLEEHGSALPLDWKKSAKMMDILCLLQLIYDNPADQRPNLHHDVISLIQNIVATWSV